MPDDIAAAARRLADLARTHGERDGYSNMRDLRVLLPVLDAVAAGRDDAGRVGRTVIALLDELRRQQADGSAIDSMRYTEGWLEIDGSLKLDGLARAAMALADAERADNDA